MEDEEENRQGETAECINERREKHDWRFGTMQKIEDMGNEGPR
jgi:hypothetical protein